jgi:hypothetical protein
LTGTSIGSAWAQAREQARFLREQAKHAREHARDQARQARDGTLGQAAQQAAQRIREEAASFRDDRGSHEWGDWHSWADWASWADWPDRNSWPGPGPHDMAAFRDLERLTRGFAGELRKVAWDSGTLGGDVLGHLRTILDDTLDRIRSEVLGNPGSSSDSPRDQPPTD